MPNPKASPGVLRSILKCKQQHPDWNRQRIANHCGVSNGLVSKTLRNPPAGESKASVEAAINEQIMHLRARNAELSQNVARLRKAVGSQKELAAAVSSAVIAAEPFEREKYSAPAKPGKPVTAVFKWSDWHVGEVTQASETEGFGRYDWKTSQDRLFYMCDAFIRWVNTQRHGYKIDRCVIFGEGDYVSGDIHRELVATNEFPLPVQTAKAGLLFGEAVTRLAPHFAEMEIFQVGADNHGRLQPKPQAKQKSQNNMSFLVHTIANAYLAKHSHVKIITSEGIKYLADVAGWKFLIEHGDTVKAWMGIPYYGIERSRAREATRRMNTAIGFDYQSIGHWHVPALVSGNILINGSLCGTSEYDHSCGRHALPAQVAFLVHPTHGIFNFTPFNAK